MSLENNIKSYLNFSKQTNFDAKSAGDEYTHDFLPKAELKKSEPKKEETVVDKSAGDRYTHDFLPEAKQKNAGMTNEQVQALKEQERIERSKKATAEREGKAEKLAKGQAALAGQVSKDGHTHPASDEDYAHQKELAGKYSDSHEKLTGKKLDGTVFKNEDKIRADEAKAGKEFEDEMKAAANEKYSNERIPEIKKTWAANRFLKEHGGTKAKGTTISGNVVYDNEDLGKRRETTANLVNKANSAKTDAANRFLAEKGTKAKATITPYDKNDKQNGTTRLAGKNGEPGKLIKTYIDNKGQTYIITSAGKSIIRDANGNMPKGSRFKTVFNNWKSNDSNEGTAVAGKSSGPSGASANRAVASAETNALAKAQYEAMQKAKRQPSKARQVR